MNSPVGVAVLGLGWTGQLDAHLLARLAPQAKLDPHLLARRAPHARLVGLADLDQRVRASSPVEVPFTTPDPYAPLTRPEVDARA